MNDRTKIRELLAPLFARYGLAFKPAKQTAIQEFVDVSNTHGVPDSVVQELVSFYEVTNGIPCLDGFDFHKCEDRIIFEWWDRRELWLGQRDDYTLRWANDRYCLGDASIPSFSEEHEYTSLTALIEGAFREWYPNAPSREIR